MITGFVLINVGVGKEKDVFSALEKMEQVEGVREVFGAYDIIARIETESLSKLINTVIESIRGTEGVAGTTTLIATDEAQGD